MKPIRAGDWIAGGLLLGTLAGLSVAGCAGAGGSRTGYDYSVEKINEAAVAERARPPAAIEPARRVEGETSWVVPFSMDASVLEASAFPAMGPWLEGVAEFRWEGAEALTFRTGHDGRPAVFGRIEIFHETGADAGGIGGGSPWIGAPAEPVRQGEIARVRVFNLQAPMFSQPGRYYAIARFSARTAGNEAIQFRSAPFWFEVRLRPAGR